MKPRHAALALTLTLCAWGSPAGAQSHDDVESLHRRGVALRDEGRPAEALELFRRAHAMHPEPRSLVRMALAEAELGRWVEADEHMSSALENPGDRFVRQHRRDLDAEATSIRGHVGRLDIQSTTPEVTLSLNGADPIPLPRAPIRVAEGALNVELRAPRCQSVRRALTVAPQSTAQLIIQLDCSAPVAPTPTPTPVATPPPAPTPAPVATPTPVPPPATPTSSSHGTLRTVAWVTAGAAAAFFVTGAIATAVGGSAAARWNDDATCLNNDRTRGENCASDRDTADTMRPLAIAGFVAGGAATAVSVALFLLSPRREGTRTAWRCGGGPGQLGLSCGASF